MSNKVFLLTLFAVLGFATITNGQRKKEVIQEQSYRIDSLIAVISNNRNEILGKDFLIASLKVENKSINLKAEQLATVNARLSQRLKDEEIKSLRSLEGYTGLKRDYEIVGNNLSNLKSRVDSLNDIIAEYKTPQLAGQVGSLSIGSQYLLEKILMIPSESELALIYGRKNITTEYSTEGAEGITVEGYYFTDLFPNTYRKVRIHWKSAKKIVDLIEVEGDRQRNNPWHTKNGVKIGTTLKELEKLNGRPFNFYGFDWDYSGYTIFKEGNLRDIGISLTTDDDRARNELGGDKQFRSTSSIAQNGSLYVQAIRIKNNAK